MENIILHLTDLHFGSDRNDSGQNQRDIVLSQLVECVKNQPEDWRPNILCISGDIAYSGKESDYQKAADWITTLLEATGIAKENIIVCAGNHDVDRSKMRGIDYPSSSQKADSWLTLPIPDLFMEPFSGLINFCKSFGISPLEIQSKNNYLIGTRKVNGLSFVVLNTSWFCLGENDQGNLWAGLPHIQALESEGVLKTKTKCLLTEPRCIAVMHHPREWLNANENSGYASSNRPSTIDYLAKRCDLLLTGHTHGGVRPPDKIVDSMWHITGGASFESAHHYNNFSLLKVSQDGFSLRRYEYDPREIDQPWTAKGEAKFYSFNYYAPPDPPSNNNGSFPKRTTSELNKSEILRRANEHATREQHKKSRAIKRNGPLPELITRDVSVFLEKEHYHVQLNNRVLPSHEEIKESLRTAIDRSSRSLLLAELGAGKSTMVSQLVVQLTEQQIISFLIPAGSLKSYSLENSNDALESLSDYIQKQILNDDSFHLRELLLKRTEVTLVVDGLDELIEVNARKLLERLNDLVHQWANLRVVGSGRPIELAGFDYEQWQLLNIPSLSENEQRQLLINEELANGVFHEDAISNVSEKIELISKSFDLASLAKTPLTLRLLYPNLTKTNTSFTLGSLLYELLQERLAAWSKRDVKNQVEEVYETEFPTFSSRLSHLGKIAHELEISKDGRVTRTSLELAFQELFSEKTRSEVLAAQAVSFFLHHVLIEENEMVSFPVQPFYEFALAAFYMNALSTDNPHTINIQWRVVSFMATLAMKLNRINQTTGYLQSYLNKLVITNGNAPAAAIIVVESGDIGLAKQLITYYQQAGFRPLQLFGDAQDYSAESIARTITMSGEDGFLWFVNEYLDPKRPATEPVLRIAGRILSYWVKEHAEPLSPKIIQHLTNIIRPYLSVDQYVTEEILRPLAILIPNSFPAEKRVSLYINQLWRRELRNEARECLLKEAQNGNKSLVLDVIIKFARRGFESSGHAATLWLQVNPGVRPPLDVIKALAKGSFGKRSDSKIVAAWTAWSDFQDEINIKALLMSWLTSDDHELACVAACLLFDRGERRIEVLGDALLRGLHDGGKIERAETVFEYLLNEEFEDTLKWLADNFHFHDQGIYLPHTSQWKIFLKGLLKLSTPRPEWLSKAIMALNDVILSRSAEIRQLLGDLLRQPGNTYVTSIRKLLRNINPEIRKRAANVLITIFPESDFEAAEISIHGSYEWSVNNWEELCQKLKYGPAVLTHLHNNYSRFRDKSRVLSLLLLYRNEVSLSLQEWLDLVEGLLLRHPYLDKVHFSQSKILPVLADKRALPILLEYLNHKDINVVSKSASSLLKYHSADLERDILIKCKIISTEFDIISLDDLNNELQKAKEDPDYLEDVLRISAQIFEKNQKEHPFSLLIRTIKQPSVWKEVVWYSICSKEIYGNSCDILIEWLFKIALHDQIAKKYIGEATKNFLSDPRIQSASLATKNSLAILAHCLGSIEDAELSRAFVRTQTNKLLEICFNARASHNLEYEFTGQIVESFENDSMNDRNLEEMIYQALLPSEQIHPDFFDLLEERIILGNIDEEEINQYTNKGFWGNSFSTLINFYFNRNLNLNILAEISTNWNNPGHKSPEVERVSKRLIKSMQLVYRNIRSNKLWREEFIKELRSLGATYLPQEAMRYLLLLSLDAELTEVEIKAIFDRVASSESVFNREDFLHRLIQWILTRAQEYLEVVLNSLHSGIHTLANHQAQFGGDVIQRLIYPAAYWMFGQRPDQESTNVFLSGLHFILISEGDSLQDITLAGVFEFIETIWMHVPPSVFRDVIKQGLNSNHADLRFVCNLLLSLVGEVEI